MIGRQEITIISEVSRPRDKRSEDELSAICYMLSKNGYMKVDVVEDRHIDCRYEGKRPEYATEARSRRFARRFMTS